MPSSLHSSSAANFPARTGGKGCLKATREYCLGTRGFGPFWWILKKEMLDAGIADFGDSLDAEWVERIDYGDPVLNILSAYAYAEYAEEYGLLYSSGHTVEFIGDDDEVINDDYVLADDFMELRAAGTR